MSTINNGYSTGQESRPTRPIVRSQLGAEREFEVWVRENSYDSVTDADGTRWQATITSRESASPDDPSALVWALTLELHAEFSGEDFIAAGAADRDKDSRLLGLLGDRSVPLTFRPLTVRGHKEDETRTKMVETLPGFRKKIGNISLVDKKRKLLSTWVDDSCRFAPQMK